MSENEKSPSSSSSLQQRPEKRLKISTADITTTNNNENEKSCTNDDDDQNNSKRSTSTTTNNNNNNQSVSSLPNSTSISRDEEIMMIPTFLKEYNPIEFLEAFENFQAVYIPKFTPPPPLSNNAPPPPPQQQQQSQSQHDSEDPPVDEKGNASTSLSSSVSTSVDVDVLSWKDLSNLYSNLSRDDQESWCIETGGKEEEKEEKSKPSSIGITNINNPTSENNTTGNNNTHTTIQPIDFLHERTYHQDEKTTQNQRRDDERYYCSFLVQKDVQSYENLLDKLPVKTLIDDWYYEPCIWIFFGRNNNNNNDDVGTSSDLQGRPEHTDSISHDGTWHYQLNGTKRWILRPTSTLLQHIKERTNPMNFLNHKNNSNKIKDWNESTKIEIECHKGDILVVNTRLWYHQTVIPPTTRSQGENGNKNYFIDEPSVSYARDFWTSKSRGVENKNCSMTNVDGLYATNDIQQGTIIFKESDMPDCELHRSKNNSNCEIIQLEDGTGAVVSSRPITAGEFFCVPESSSEEEEEEDDDEEYDDEEEEEAYGEAEGEQ